MSMIQQLKRNSVVTQLQKYGVSEIDGQPLDQVKYSTLLKTLALKRAAQD